MKIDIPVSSSQINFAATINATVPAAAATILLVLSAGASGTPQLTAIAGFLGGIGNDTFLIATNLLIIAWAWRQRLYKLIKLTLWLDFVVWLIVQGTKLLVVAPWTLRPNGGDGGFPSGHATHGFAMAFLLTYLFPRFGWLWYSLAAAISWSRLETFAHSGFQITAGVILGMAIGSTLVARWLIRPETDVPAAGKVPAPVTAISPAKQVYAADRVS